MEKKCFLFDLNGTIINDIQISYGSVCEVFLRLGRKKPTMLKYRKLMGPDYWQIYKTHGFKKSDRKIIDELFHGIFYSKYLRESRKFDDAVPVMESMKRMGFIIGIVSNHSRKNLEKYIETFGLKKIVDVSVGRDEVKMQKPSAQCLRLALKKVGVSPKNAFYIGDQTFDIIAAKSAGIFAVALSRGGSYHTKKMLLGAKPDIIVSKLQSLLRLVNI